MKCENCLKLLPQGDTRTLLRPILCRECLFGGSFSVEQVGRNW